MINYTPATVVKSVAKYSLLPAFWPRVVDFVPRFWMMAYFMALIFETIRLIPSGHPCLNPSQIGKYRIRDVLAVAANNLKGGIGHADQYIVFVVFVMGTIILMLQFVLLAGLIVMNTAHAAIPFVNIFTTANPQIDIAHLMLDRIFGIPQFFQSCYDPVTNAANATLCEKFLAPTAFPTQFQQAMQALFKFYSMGMLAVAGFLIVYYIFAMLVETVGTGVPFGKRFQSFYTPVRLVIAVLLMLPLAYGFSTGQYIVLWSAKWGSAMATNAWYVFNNRVGDNPLGLEPQQMVGLPKVPDIESILNFFYVVHACKAAYELTDDTVPVNAYLVRPSGSISAGAAQQVTTGTTFTSARNFMAQGDVNIVFGQQDDRFTRFDGNVKPVCGVVSIPALSKDVSGIPDIYNIYFQSIMNIWANADMRAYGKRMACNLSYGDKTTGCKDKPTTDVDWDADDAAAAGQNFYIGMRTQVQATFNSNMTSQLSTLRTTTNTALTMDATTLGYGWGGAGLWFNKMVSFNGALVDALMITPTPTQYPLIMEHIAKKKKTSEKNTDPKDKFAPTTSGAEKDITLDKSLTDSGLEQTDMQAASFLNAVYQQVQKSEGTAKPRVANSNSPVKNWISLLFGQTGLFDFRNNGDVFPLAKLSMLGREMIDKTIILLAVGGLMTGAGGVVEGMVGPMGSLVGTLGPQLMTFSTFGIMIGILLYYVVPFLPFAYFFFAVGRWVKAVFEAMVGIPLWAMAHLRLGGDGIPGSAGSMGYFLVLEILLRPILTLFGLLASVAVFAAMSAGFDSVFNLAVANVGGFDMTTLSSGGADTLANSARDGMDALFYTAIYAILTYMMATSSFKLIDIFPNTIMRFAGSNASSFNDRVDVAVEIDRYMTQNVNQMAEGIRKKVAGAAEGIGESGRSLTQLSQDRDARNRIYNP